MQKSCADLAKSPDEQHLNNSVNECKAKMEHFSIEEQKGAQIRSKAFWAEHGENTKYFLGLEKHRGKQKVMTTVKTQTGHVVNTQNEIMEAQVDYYEDLYKKKSTYNNKKLNKFIQNVNIPKLTVDQMESCEGSISEIECKNALKEMKITSSPGSDGLNSLLVQSILE